MKKYLNLLAALLLTQATLFANGPGGGDEVKIGLGQRNLDFRHKQVKNHKSLSERILFSGKKSENEINNSGFYLNFGVFFPAKSAVYIGTGYNLELGNLFHIFDAGPLGIGIRATWASFDIAADGVFVTPGFSLVRGGPQVTYPLSENMGIDLYYTFGYTYAMWIYSGDVDTFVGRTHETGVAFRIKIFNVGINYRFGNVRYIDVNSIYRVGTSNARVVFGFKF